MYLGNIFKGQFVRYSMNKKGVSPVIATVLLVAIVVILAVIIFLWARGFTEEIVQKSGKPPYQVCDEIQFEANVYNGQLQIINTGDIPLYNLEIKIKGGGSETVQKWESNIGIGKSENIPLDRSGDQVEVFPVFLGTTGNTRKAHTCTDNGKIAE